MSAPEQQLLFDICGGVAYVAPPLKHLSEKKRAKLDMRTRFISIKTTDTRDYAAKQGINVEGAATKSMDAISTEIARLGGEVYRKA